VTNGSDVDTLHGIEKVTIGATTYWLVIRNPSAIEDLVPLR